MGMFRWLKKEELRNLIRKLGCIKYKLCICGIMSHSQINSGSRDRGKSSTTSSPTSSHKIENERDEGYLEKLTQFNKYREPFLKNIPDVEDRRRSQMDFPGLKNNNSNDTRLSLGNPRKTTNQNQTLKNLGNRSQQEENEYTNMSPKKLNDSKRSATSPRKNNDSNRVSKSSLNKSHKASPQNDQNKPTGFPSEFSPELQNLFKTTKNFESDSEAINNPNFFEEHESEDLNIIDKFYSKSCLPFEESPEDCEEEGYQRVINKHGEVVEYALPYNERNIDESVTRLPKINEHSLEITPDNTLLNQANSKKYSLDSHNIHALNRYEQRPQAVPRRRRVADLEVKFVRTPDGNPNPVDADYIEDPDAKGEIQHNKEFVEAIEDLLSLGQWSKRQLDNSPPDLPPRTKNQNKNKTALDDAKVNADSNEDAMNTSLSAVREINPHEYKSRQILKLDDLEWIPGSIRGHPEGALAWGTAKWGCQTVSIRAPRPLLSQMKRAKSGMARDIHILTNMYHPNVALLMAVAFYDNYQVASVIEPCPATLSQILHHKPRSYPMPLERALQYLQQICSALSFLHNQGYIHTNISSHTILVTQSLVTAKLCGFELAVSVDNSCHLKYNNPEVSCVEKMKDNSGDVFHIVNRSKNKTPSSVGKKKKNTWESAFIEAMHSDSHRKCENESDGSSDCDKNNDKKCMPPPDTWIDYVWGETQDLADRELLGLHNWQAPELFWEENGLVRACTCSDVFSLSVVLWECCTVRIPWLGKSYNEIAENYLKNITPDLSNITNNFIKKILKKGFVISPLERIMRPIDMQLYLKLAEEQIGGSGINRDSCWFDLNINTPNANIEHPIKLEKETASFMGSPTPNSTAHYENINLDSKCESQIPEKDIGNSSMNNHELSDEEIKQRTATQIIAQIEQNNKYNKESLSLNLEQIKDDNYVFPPTPSTGRDTPPTPINRTDYFNNYDSSKSSENYQECDALSKISEITEDSKTHLNKEENLKNTSSGKALLLNITPKFYTPLEIVSPSTANGDSEFKLEKTSKSYNAEQDTNSYTFNIDNYSLPDTPIARSTKLRKNAWLTNQKQKTEFSCGRKKRFNFSFSGSTTYKNENKAENHSKSLIESIDNSEKVMSTLLKPLSINVSPKIRKNTPSPSVDISHEDSEDRNHKVATVKSRLNIFLSKRLNSSASVQSSPHTYSPMNKSFPAPKTCNKSHRTRPCSPLVKPASHRTEAGCTEFHSCNSNVVDSPQYPPSLYPAYRNEAIKPASHQEEIGVPNPINKSLSFIRTPSQLDFYDSSSCSDTQIGNSELKAEAAEDHVNHIASSPGIYRSYAEIFSSPTYSEEPPTVDNNRSTKNTSGCVQPNNHRKNTRASSARERDHSASRPSKPASHNHGLDIMSPLMNKYNGSFCNVPPQIREAVARGNVPKKDVSTRFENSLWKNEKNKCINSMQFNGPSKSSSPILLDTRPKNTVQTSTNTPRSNTRDSEIQTDKEYFTHIYERETRISNNFSNISKIDRIIKIPDSNLKTPVKQVYNDNSKIYASQTLPLPRRHTSSKNRKRFIKHVSYSDSKRPDSADIDDVGALQYSTGFINKLSCAKNLDNVFKFNSSLNEQSGSNLRPESHCSTCGSDLSRNRSLNVKSKTRGFCLSSTLKELHNVNVLCSDDSIWPILDGDETVSLSSSYGFSGNVLQRCQPIQMLQNARSTEDLYIDDEFSSGNLGAHMQLRYDVRLSRADLYKELGMDSSGSAYSLNSQMEEGSTENIQEIEEITSFEVQAFEPSLNKISEESDGSSVESNNK